MSNPIVAADGVTLATDKLMKRLLKEAQEPGASVDFALSVVQAATRWTAVKNRMSLPDEEKFFDGARRELTGAPTPGSTDPSSGRRTDPPRPAAARPPPAAKPYHRPNGTSRPRASSPGPRRQ